MARPKNQNEGLVAQTQDGAGWQSTAAEGGKKSPRLMKATDFLKGGSAGVSLDSDTDDSLARHSDGSSLSLDEVAYSEENEADYHVRAGRIGGQTTKQRHRDTNFYKEIGSRGGTTTMSRHGAEYNERRKKGGETTRERYGDEYYHNIAAKAARTKQDATRLRNEAIKTLMLEGYKIPTIIKLTLEDAEKDPKIQPLLKKGPLAEYLAERPQSENPQLFLSQSGKPLSLANTYTVMERHRPADE
jgi:hypothetical protein